MSESHFHCFKCPGRQFSDLLEAVKHIISETAKGKGSKGVQVKCCVEGCLKSVRKSKLRLHIRKSHTRHCSVNCLDCPAKFVEQRDLDIHRINGCSRRKQTKKIAAAVPSSTDRESHTRLLETFFENVDFSDSSAVNSFITNKLQLDEANRNAVSKAVDSLCKYLQQYRPSSSKNESPFSINKFIKNNCTKK